MAAYAALPFAVPAALVTRKKFCIEIQPTLSNYDDLLVSLRRGIVVAVETITPDMLAGV